ncbi:hypothetical protein [Nocardia sp. NPDC003979]
MSTPTTTLWRPTGPAELALVAESGTRADLADLNRNIVGTIEVVRRFPDDAPIPG